MIVTLSVLRPLVPTFDQAIGNSVFDQPHDILCAGLSDQTLAVKLHRALGDEEPAGDLFAGQFFEQQMKNLELALIERGAAVGAGLFDAAERAVDYAGGKIAGKVVFATEDAVDREFDFHPVDIGQEIAIGTVLEHSPYMLVVVEGAEADDLDGRMKAFDLAGAGHAIGGGHEATHHHQIAITATKVFEGLRGIAGLHDVAGHF